MAVIYCLLAAGDEDGLEGKLLALCAEHMLAFAKRPASEEEGERLHLSRKLKEGEGGAV